MTHKEGNIDKKHIPRLMVSTRWEAARWCHKYESVLTVFSPWYYCDWGHDDHLIVEFADTYHYQDGAPTIDQIQDILNWGYERRQVESMLVHCKAGQSRSIEGFCVRSRKVPNSVIPIGYLPFMSDAITSVADKFPVEFWSC
jgi:hypothetical protein